MITMSALPADMGLCSDELMSPIGCGFADEDKPKPESYDSSVSGLRSVSAG